MAKRLHFLISFSLVLTAASVRASAPYADALKAEARRKGLARNPGWLRLLHYKKGLFGSSSAADGPAFFLSRRGHKDPQAELDADLDGFFEALPADPEAQQPQCRFPARYEWLKEELSFDPSRLPDRPCPRLDAWMSRMDPGGITLVYASAYMNNPASMYGHTFLRVEPAGARSTLPLLAYSANFAAQTADTNGIIFAVKGLLGGYPGRFSTLPYYMKVQQYANMESRDLWEYHLNVSSAAARFVLLHLWEMGTTWFNYYFLTENCSWQLLPLLEAAVPSLDLSRRFHFKAIPVDTLQAILSEPGFVTGRTLRPSAVRSLLARRALLTPEEVKAAEALARRPGEASTLDGVRPERRTLVMDSAYDRLRLRHRFARFPTPRQDDEEHALLMMRQKESMSPSENPPNTRDAFPPESGHGTGRIGLSGGRSGGEGVMELSLRGAMHDLEEDPAGYIPGSRLEMFHGRFRYYDGPHRLAVQNLTAVDVMSLFPLDRWVRYPSWRLGFGWDTPLDRPVAPGHGLLFRLGGGSGPSIGDKEGRIIAYALIDVDTGFGGTLEHNYRLGLGGEGGVLLRVGRLARLRGEAFHRRYVAGETGNVDGVRGVLSLSLGKDWETRVTAAREGRRREGFWALHRYL